jgi:hypothetical protein
MGEKTVKTEVLPLLQVPLLPANVSTLCSVRFAVRSAVSSPFYVPFSDLDLS